MARRRAADEQSTGGRCQLNCQCQINVMCLLLKGECQRVPQINGGCQLVPQIKGECELVAQVGRHASPLQGYLAHKKPSPPAGWETRRRRIEYRRPLSRSPTFAPRVSCPLPYVAWCSPFFKGTLKQSVFNVWSLTSFASRVFCLLAYVAWCSPLLSPLLVKEPNLRSKGRRPLPLRPLGSISSELSTHKTVKARFWPLLPAQSH